MSDIVIVACIAAIPPTLAAFLSCWLSYRNSLKLETHGEKMSKLEHSVNGASATLLALTAKASRAEGIIEGKELMS